MARKQDNTIMWVLGLGVAGYLYYQYKQTQQQVNTTALLSAGNPNLPLGAGGAAPPILALPPSTTSQSSAPSGITANPANMPAPLVTSAPTNNMMDTSGLVPAQIGPGNIPLLKPGQSLALDANGKVLTDNSGKPLIFQPQMNDSLYQNFENNYAHQMSGIGDCV